MSTHLVSCFVTEYMLASFLLCRGIREEGEVVAVMTAVIVRGEREEEGTGLSLFVGGAGDG